MRESNNRCLEAALAYGRLGWPTFPLSPGTKVLLKGTRGFEVATSDPDQIRHWWARWPEANISLPPGAEGMVAIKSGLNAGAQETRGSIPGPGVRPPPTVLRGPPLPGASRPTPVDDPECPALQPDLGQDACCWLDDYIAFSQKWSPRSFAGYHEAYGLWLLSTVAARRVVAHFGQPRYTNLYII